jgi:hypothetical protein
LCFCSWGEGGRGRVNIEPPRQISKDLLIKMQLNPKLEDPRWQFCSESLDPRDFGKNMSYPSPGFSTRVYLWFCPWTVVFARDLTAYQQG